MGDLKETVTILQDEVVKLIDIVNGSEPNWNRTEEYLLSLRSDIESAVKATTNLLTRGSIANEPLAKTVSEMGDELLKQLTIIANAADDGFRCFVQVVTAISIFEKTWQTLITLTGRM